MNYWDDTEKKRFCTVKETSSRKKRPPTRAERISANDKYSKGHYPKYTENLCNSVMENNPIKNGQTI